MLKSIVKVVKNPIIGPIFVSTITLILIISFYLPNIFKENEKNKIIKETTVIVSHLKKFRDYYNEFVLSKVQEKTNIVVDYNHEYSSNTIPLPSTTIHNLASELSKENDVLINFFSEYPFPNRENRVLDRFQKESIEYFKNNKKDFYLKEDIYKDEKVIRVAYPDYMVSQSCVNCHNNRIDTPKNNWEIGDVRGVIETIMPIQNQVVLTAFQTQGIIIFIIFVLLAFSIHYGIVNFKREKQIKEQTLILKNEVEKRTKDLIQSNLLLKQYKKAVDASAIVSKTDLKGIITYVNKSFCDVTGYKKEELIGSSQNIIRHPDMPKEFFENLWKTIQSKQIFKEIIKNKKKNNEVYFMASTIIPILDNKDEIVEYLSLRYDITELVQTREKALKAEEAKSIFLANMSHEIRTPLNAIIGFSEILSKANLEFKEKKQAKIILKSANSLLNIVNDVLDVSKIENSKFELEETEFSLFEMGEYLVELFSISSNKKNIKFFYNIDSNLPKLIKSDSTRLQQVLTNLLSNAIKFTPKDGEINFDISVLKLDENTKKAKIRFRIKDSGIGMTPSQQEVIFKPFAQADSGINRKFGGTGLGLTICWNIVKAMNSTICITSQINQGSEFSFELELDTIQNNSNVNYSLKNKTLEATPLKPTFNANILVAEDNTINQMLMQVLLEDLNINHTIVSNGQEAVQEYKRNKYDLIFMDINMPILDGISATKEIKKYQKEENHYKVPIIALTANSIAGDKEKYLKEGMDAYLTKPIIFKDLVSLLKDFLNSSNSLDK